MSEHDELAEVMRALRERYLTELPDRLAAIAAALAARDGSAHALVHRLHGSAGSYGLHAVSEAAARLEEALEAADPAAIERAHAALHAVAASAIGGA